MPTHFKGNSEQILALDTFIKFTRASNALEARMIHRSHFDDLTLTQFGVLETLLHLGPLSQSEICTKLLKSGGNVTLVIDNLEKRGLVRRQTKPGDRRVTTVLLTEKGEEHIQRIFPEQVKAVVEEFGVLTTDEQKTLGALCKKLGKQT
jgi:MarR family 2-MHQ and catechol resistance regulon transcriptional repressor